MPHFLYKTLVWILLFRKLVFKEWHQIIFSLGSKLCCKNLDLVCAAVLGIGGMLPKISCVCRVCVVHDPICWFLHYLCLSCHKCWDDFCFIWKMGENIKIEIFELTKSVNFLRKMFNTIGKQTSDLENKLATVMNMKETSTRSP